MKKYGALILGLLLGANICVWAQTPIINDNFSGAKGAAISGRAPDTANTTGGKWAVVAFNTGGGFQATIETDSSTSTPLAYLSCAGNSTGGIAIPLSGNGSSTKLARFTISAELRGASPSLGFYSVLAAQDKDDSFDSFADFSGLQLLGDGTLALYRSGGLISSIKYTGTFDPKEFHKLSYEVDTISGAISHISLQGSTSDYSKFSVSSIFNDATTAYAAIASLGEGGRDNQAYAEHFLVAALPPSTTPAPTPAVVASPTAASSSILIKNGDRIGYMGDSITALGNSPKGYVQLVIAGLKEEGVDAVAVPAGHSGDTSGNMVSRVNIDVLHKGANWMTISCGVNDVMMQEHGFGVDLESYKKNVAKMVAKAQAWKVRVVILTATPLGEEADSKNNQTLAGYNDFLRSFAAEKKLPLADMNAAFWKVLNSPPDRPSFAPGKRLLADGIHPNDDGQFLMATTLLGALGVPSEDMPRVEKTLGDATKAK